MNASSGWSERSRHNSVALPDGSIVLMGGWGGHKTLNDTWRSTDMGAHWTLMNANSGWLARWSPSSVALPDGSIVLMGGYIGGPNSNDTWRSTDKGAHWVRLPDAGWSAREGHSSVVLPDGSIVLTGGEYWDGTLNDTWRLQTAGIYGIDEPVHTYTEPGSYTVTLQAYNADGYNSSRKVGYITVTGPTMVGVFRNATHTFYLKNGTKTTSQNWGQSTDTPVTGDWNGDGLWDVGVFRNASHTFYLKNGSVTTSVNWGRSTDRPVTGRWS